MSRHPVDALLDHPHFFQGPLSHVVREQADDPRAEWIVIHYEAGGTISVYTECPLVFTEPEQH